MKLNNKLKATKILTKICVIDFEHEIFSPSEAFESHNFIDKYKSILANNRKIDADLNRTTNTINKVKIEIYNNLDKHIEVKNCSTGEQKSILLTIFLCVANMVKSNNSDRSPIILIDEAMAHLDSDHKEFLFKELSNLNSQIWFSGVSKDLFYNIDNQTVFFEMENII